MVFPAPKKMAHMSFSLPVSYLHRSLPTQQSESSVQDPHDVQSSAWGDDAEDAALDQSVVEPTGYELERKASIAGWEEIRRGTLHAVVEMTGI